MALSIKNDEADYLARSISRITGESLTDVVVSSLKMRLLKEEGKATSGLLEDELEGIGRRCERLPVLDKRSPEEILGYDERGLSS